MIGEFFVKYNFHAKLTAKISPGKVVIRVVCSTVQQISFCSVD